jgi:hypothetical protein
VLSANQPINHHFIINLFVHLLDYNVIVYTEQIYRYTVLSIYINSYLNSLCHNYNKEQQKQVIQKISQIEKLIQNIRKLELFKFPELSSFVISKLKLAKERLQYTEYRYICCYIIKIQKHCKEVYN